MHRNPQRFCRAAKSTTISMCAHRPFQAETDAIRAAQKLIELANERGGLDNITAIVVRFQEESKGWLSWLKRGSGKKE